MEGIPGSVQHGRSTHVHTVVTAELGWMSGAIVQESEQTRHD